MQNQSLTARATDLPFSHQSVVSITHKQNIICSKTLICRQLFAGHVVANEKEGKTASNDNLSYTSLSPLKCRYVLLHMTLKEPEDIPSVLTIA